MESGAYLYQEIRSLSPAHVNRLSYHRYCIAVQRSYRKVETVLPFHDRDSWKPCFVQLDLESFISHKAANTLAETVLLPVSPWLRFN